MYVKSIIIAPALRYARVCVRACIEHVRMCIVYVRGHLWPSDNGPAAGGSVRRLHLSYAPVTPYPTPTRTRALTLPQHIGSSWFKMTPPIVMGGS